MCAKCFVMAVPRLKANLEKSPLWKGTKEKRKETKEIKKPSNANNPTTILIYVSIVSFDEINPSVYRLTVTTRILKKEIYNKLKDSIFNSYNLNKINYR